MSEPLDANKTALTHKATATAAAWLDAIGCKPIETEVPVGHQWIADLATFWSPTPTEAKRSRLLAWLERCPTVGEGLDRFGVLYRRLGGRITIVVEVKVSRADLLKDLDRKYGRTPALARPAHCVIVAAPTSVVKGEYLPSWLELSEDCSRVRRWHGEWNITPVPQHQVENVIAAVAIRRDHHTRYANARRFLKAYRAKWRFKP
jgi:hypothetical protein